MIQAKNKRTKIEHYFTDEEWKSAEENGLHKKFQVIKNLKGDKNPVHFSPPELKGTGEKKGKKKNNAG